MGLADKTLRGNCCCWRPYENEKGVEAARSDDRNEVASSSEAEVDSAVGTRLSNRNCGVGRDMSSNRKGGLDEADTEVYWRPWRPSRSHDGHDDVMEVVEVWMEAGRGPAASSLSNLP